MSRRVFLRHAGTVTVLLGCHATACDGNQPAEASDGGGGGLSADPDAGGHSAGAADDASTPALDAGDTSDLTAAVQLPWVPHTDGPTCQHVEVVKSCTDGWCQIPAGCFVMGSPEDEVGRGMNTETLTTVHLTRSFAIGQFEVTREEWSRTGWALPEGIEPTAGIEACDAPNCPMARVSRFAAMFYANWFSEHADPALPPCYRLDGCTGSPEYALDCTSVMVETDSQSVYDCTGYRLPTEPEWEYAARAGARTAFFAGPMSEAAAADWNNCVSEPALIDWAWYCGNTPDNRAQPVGRRGANAWGLHDILGNVDERVSNPEWTSLTPSSAIDPWGGIDASLPTSVRGGRMTSTPQMARLADRTTWGKAGAVGTGFRLVRTLP